MPSRRNKHFAVWGHDMCPADVIQWIDTNRHKVPVSLILDENYVPSELVDPANPMQHEPEIFGCALWLLRLFVGSNTIEEKDPSIKIRIIFSACSTGTDQTKIRRDLLEHYCPKHKDMPKRKPVQQLYIQPIIVQPKSTTYQVVTTKTTCTRRNGITLGDFIATKH